MAPAYTMLRITKTTRAELERIRLRFEMGEKQSRLAIARDSRGRFSLEQVILRLIRELDLKDERSRRRRNKGKGGEPNNGETTADQLPPTA